MTHADISTENNTIKSLCGKKSGSYIWQDISLIGFDGRVSAEVDCELCQMTGRLYGSGYSLSRARKAARK